MDKYLNSTGLTDEYNKISSMDISYDEKANLFVQKIFDVCKNNDRLTNIALLNYLYSKKDFLIIKKLIDEYEGNLCK